VESCEHCRAERNALAGVMRDMLAVNVPEPSPLFWDRLSARVRESLEHEPAPMPGGPGWLTWLSGHWAWSAVTLALCVTVAGIGWQEMRTARPSSLIARQTAPQASASSTHEDDAMPIGPKANVVRAPRVPRAQLAENTSAGMATIRPAVATDDEWNLMMRVAEDIPWDDDGPAADGTVSGLSLVRPETTDAVVRELTADERRELVRLLHEEMTRPPSS
jgi:hypothetical protein